MKIPNFLSQTSALIFLLIFVFSCKSKPVKKIPPSENSTTLTTEKKEDKTVKNNEETNTTTNTETNTATVDPVNESPPAVPVNVPIRESGKTVTSADLVSELCTNQELDLVAYLIQQANRITRDSIAYDQSKGNDCSGIFHRYLNTVKGLCPNSIYPTMKTARDTRSLGKWYNDNGNLTIIRNPKEESDLIKPGAIMFYGYGNRYKSYDHKKMTIDTLTTKNIGINHIAVVVSVVEKDGVLESYKIFHGRNPRHPAGITNCVRYNPRRPDFPTYGNWNEPWLAVADILTKDRE